MLQIGEIPAKSQRLRPCLPNVFDGSIDCSLIDIGHGDLRPFLRERGRDRAPETASSTEDKRRLPFQPQIHLRPIFHYVEA